MRAFLVLLVSGLALLSAASGIGLKLAAAALVKPYDVVHVPSGRAIRWAALGHRTFVSDLYWLSTVQYIGDPAADRRGWDQLFPLVDLVTDLDPRHGYAYQTAGIVLSAAGRLDESDRILEKGIEKGPRYWSYPFYLSFNAWFYRGDYEAGARWAEVAARTPGASPNISQLAVSLRSKTGAPDRAVELLRDLRTGVKDEAIASRLDEQLKLATVERDAQGLEVAAARFEAERGRPPASLDELVRAGLVRAVPEDPFGGRYVWHPEERKIRSSAHPFRFSLREKAHVPSFKYQAPQRAGGPAR